MTNEMWNYDPFMTRPDASIVGFEVEATDGSIGSIDEASADPDDSYIVVDTGFWIFGKKRVVPARVISQISINDERVFLTVSKQQVKDAPEYSEGWSSDHLLRDQLGAHFVGTRT